MNRVYILTDAIGSGKTTYLKKWSQKTPKIAGVLSPVIDGKRMFQDIQTGTLMAMETENKDLEVGRFNFDSTSFKMAEEIILKAWTANTSDFIVIDEIGPLEINKDLGFHKLLLNLSKNNQSKKPNLLLVVRDYCLDAFLKKYDFVNVEIMSLQAFKDSFSP